MYNIGRSTGIVVEECLAREEPNYLEISKPRYQCIRYKSNEHLPEIKPGPSHSEAGP